MVVGVEATKASEAKQREIEAFKYKVYLWEIVITAILIVASYFVLKSFKKNKRTAEDKNKRYYTGEQG